MKIGPLTEEHESEMQCSEGEDLMPWSKGMKECKGNMGPDRSEHTAACPELC